MGGSVPSGKIGHWGFVMVLGVPGVLVHRLVLGGKMPDRVAVGCGVGTVCTGLLREPCIMTSKCRSVEGIVLYIIHESICNVG